MSSRLLQIKTDRAQPIRVGRWSLVPLARSVSLRLPGMAGGCVWGRPIGVQGTGPDGQSQGIPVRDTTRWAQVLIWLGAAGLVLVSWVATARRRQARAPHYGEARRC